MAALKPELRKDLERVIIKARNLVVADVTDRLKELNVHEGKRGALSDTQAKLRVRLRAHGKQIGDIRNSQSDAQQIDRLVQECAYEQWHRMMFVRFLAENEFLIDPEYSQSVSMEALAEIAEESKVDQWVLGGQFASAALPAIFREDDPLSEVRLSQETQRDLNDLLGSLPAEVFTADDSLGWVYQFWQSEEKDRVNASGDKIDGRSIPAVTQLFTEHYMVLFLLHNTLGAWHAGKVLAQNPALAVNAKDEAELRRAVALETAGGYEFEYLRFVHTPNTSISPSPLYSGERGPGGEGFALPNASAKSPSPPAPLPAAGRGEQEIHDGPWRPMGGTFAGWPKTAAKLKVLDPSCGSGHFLVAAFELLVRLRMHEEGLSVETAVEAVLSDNLFGLEIDPRCTQIAAFNVAMAVWKLFRDQPQGVSPRLPSLLPMRNIACSGIPLGNSRAEWMQALKTLSSPRPASGRGAGGEGLLDLGFQWGQLYDMFSKADTLGSLINPQRFFGSGLMTDKQLEQISEALSTIIADDRNATDEQQELGAAAQGLTRATELLAGRYTLVTTNVPYLGRGKQDDHLKKYLDTQYALGKADLATAFVLRCLEFCSQGGSTALVTPQNWLFLPGYKMLRKSLLAHQTWNLVTRLGPNAFRDMNFWASTTALTVLSRNNPRDLQQLYVTDVSSDKNQEQKASMLRGDSEWESNATSQVEQLQNPDSRISLKTIGSVALLSEHADAPQGIKTGDDSRFRLQIWELGGLTARWRVMQGTTSVSQVYAGLDSVLDWASDGKDFSRLQGMSGWGKPGVVLKLMGQIQTSLHVGAVFDSNVTIVVPKDEEDLSAIWAYCSSAEYAEELNSAEQAAKINNATATKVPFDRKAWREHSKNSEFDPIPAPESDDPTQWLFHGRPEQSPAPLQVAVARLMGYRWPAELDGEMRLSQRARELVARCSELDKFSDDDGIVCIPSVRGEDSASDRLLRLLNACSPLPTLPLPRYSGGEGRGEGGEGIGVSSTESPSPPAPLPFAPQGRGEQEASDRISGGEQGDVPEAGAYGARFGDLETWLRDKFFQEHCELFHQRPFIWHIWDGKKDGFAALVNYHKLAGPQGKKLLESLTYSYLGDWISRQEAAVKNNESGADDRLLAAKELQEQLEAILHGEPPYDIFVRWKPLHQQPIGWTPDINDGVRMNIRPFMLAELSRGRKGAGVLRFPPKIKWTKDRGKEPNRPTEDYPWFWSWDENTDAPTNFAGGDKFTGDRWNDLHYTNAFKQQAREQWQQLNKEPLQ